MTQIREKTISQLFNEFQPLIKNRLKPDTRFLWTFRPYPITEQFVLLDVEPISWEYLSYLYWSSKLHQDRLLMQNGDSNLSSHLHKKHNVLQRRYSFSSELEFEKFDGCIVTGNFSSGGQEMFFSANSIENSFRDEFLLRIEKNVGAHIPICQIAVTDGLSTHTYDPSVMIIKEKDGHFDYLGSDFNFEEWLPDFIVNDLTELTESVGLALAKNGFKGVYNCDYIFIPESNDLFFTEVNPRNSGCSFILDKLYSENYLSGNTEAIYLMPTFLNFHIKIYGSLPHNLKNISFKNFSESNCDSSFCYIFYDKEKRSLLEEHLDFLPGQSIDTVENQVAMIRTYTQPIIKNPLVPTGLIDHLEKLYQ